MKNNYACIGLFNPKSVENVGSVMRAAGCYGVNSVFYTGVRYDRAKPFYTDTKKVYEKIPLIGVKDLMDFYIFGPEDDSLKKEITDLCQDIVYIPTEGCMNLAATVNVVLYDRLAKGDNFSHHQYVLSHKRKQITSGINNE